MAQHGSLGIEVAGTCSTIWTWSTVRRTARPAFDRTQTVLLIATLGPRASQSACANHRRCRGAARLSVFPSAQTATRPGREPRALSRHVADRLTRYTTSAYLTGWRQGKLLTCCLFREQLPRRMPWTRPSGGLTFDHSPPRRLIASWT